MGGFLRRPLKILDRVFGFDLGSTIQSPSEFDLGASIQPVADTMRVGERSGDGSFNEGYWIAMGTQAHTAAAWLYDDVNLYQPTSAAGGYTDVDTEREWLWMIDAYGYADVQTDFGSCGVALNAGTGGGAKSLLGPYDGTAANPLRLLFFGEALASMNFGGSLGFGVIDTDGPAVRFVRPIPIPFAQGVARFGSRSLGVGPTNITGVLLFWRGPKGATPPGMG